jgi:chorismate synthase
MMYHAPMSTLTYHTAGESLGPALTCLIRGLPAGLVFTGRARRRPPQR